MRSEWCVESGLNANLSYQQINESGEMVRSSNGILKVNPRKGSVQLASATTHTEHKSISTGNINPTTFPSSQFFGLDSWPVLTRLPINCQNLATARLVNELMLDNGRSLHMTEYVAELKNESCISVHLKEMMINRKYTIANGYCSTCLAFCICDDPSKHFPLNSSRISHNYVPIPTEFPNEFSTLEISLKLPSFVETFSGSCTRKRWEFRRKSISQQKMPLGKMRIGTVKYTVIQYYNNYYIDYNTIITIFFISLFSTFSHFHIFTFCRFAIHTNATNAFIMPPRNS